MVKWLNWGAQLTPETFRQNPEGRKVMDVIHWVSATKGIPAEVRIYDRLFTEAALHADDDFWQI